MTRTQVKVTGVTHHSTQPVLVSCTPKMSMCRDQGHSHVLKLNTSLSNQKKAKEVDKKNQKCKTVQEEIESNERYVL